MPRIKNSKKRKTLWNINSKCFYCGVETLLIEYGSKPGKLPDNAATLEHLKSRLHPDRHEAPQPGKRRIVLACAKCNAEQNDIYQASLPIETLHARSHRGINKGTRYDS